MLFRLTGAGVAAALLLSAGAAGATTFQLGNLVVSVEGKGLTSGSYTDNQAAPLSLFQFSHNGTASASFVNALVLPQAAHGPNYAVSGEYGSSSEAQLQLTGNGKYLTIAGYGVNAAAFNANPTAYGTLTTDPSKSTALAQSGSLTGKGYIAVPRVAVTISVNGLINSSTGLYNVFNGNNPRSVYSADGTSFYVSGQGNYPDSTGGAFLAPLGGGSATPITGNDTVNGNAKPNYPTAQDTRVVTEYNGQIYVSYDSKEGQGFNRSGIGSLGSNPTGLVNPNPAANGTTQPDTLGPSQLNGLQKTGKISITAATTNGINAAGKQINASPEGFFFANATTLYIADSGQPKNDSASNGLGDGGLQKWSFVSGSWVLDYTLSAGLHLVPNTAASGVTGLLGLAGQVVGNNVELFATSYIIGDIGPTYLYGITDVLGATSKPAGESFATLATAPDGSNFKGVSFAPSAIPEPASWALLVPGFGFAGWAMRRRRPVAAA